MALNLLKSSFSVLSKVLFFFLSPSPVLLYPLVFFSICPWSWFLSTHHSYLIDSLPSPSFSISIAFILSFVLQMNQIRSCPLRTALEKTSFTLLLLYFSAPTLKLLYTVSSWMSITNIFNMAGSLGKLKSQRPQKSDKTVWLGMEESCIRIINLMHHVPKWISRSNPFRL